MSCYFRHMKEILEEVGVEVTKENKKEVDGIIHRVVGVGYKNCPPLDCRKRAYQGRRQG